MENKEIDPDVKIGRALWKEFGIPYFMVAKLPARKVLHLIKQLNYILEEEEKEIEKRTKSNV